MSLRPALTLTICALLALAVATPAAAQDAAQDGRPSGPPASTPMAEPLEAPAGTGVGVRLSTDKGDIVIGLFDESAPVASENFLNLVRSGYYDGIGFHRLVPGFVIQGGDPSGDGTGGPGYTIPDETVVGRYGRGVVAMARSQAPNSQGSQFFIVLDDAAEGALEQYRTYAIFGRVIEGMDVVDAIAAMPNGGGDANRALEPVIINTATVEPVILPPEPERSDAPPGAGGLGEPVGDKELEGLIPATVGEQPLTATSFTGEELLAGTAPDEPIAELPGLIEGTGRSIEDFSVASAQTTVGDAFIGVIAARLKGGDASALAERLPAVLLGFGGLPPRPTTVAGREVSVFDPYEGALVGEGLHVWSDGEILWMVLAPEPYLSELLSPTD